MIELEELISRAGGLPALPATHSRLMTLLSEEDYSTTDVAKTISADPAMSLKVLKLANSSLYGLNRMIDSVQKAVVILGGRELVGLTLTTAVLDSFGSEFENPYFKLKDFWIHSKSVAITASLLVQRFGRRTVPSADVAWAAGLMHDIGRLLLVRSTPDEYAQVIESSKSQTCALENAESKYFGFTHADLAAALAESWNLPQSLTHALQYHHHPETIKSNESEYPIVAIIHLADYFSKVAGYGIPGLSDICGVCPKAWEWSKFTQDELEPFIELIKKTTSELSID
jgi:putative nucleotidyltransferase with HDIG domain